MFRMACMQVVVLEVYPNDFTAPVSFSVKFEGDSEDVESRSEMLVLHTKLISLIDLMLASVSSTF